MNNTGGNKPDYLDKESAYDILIRPPHPIAFDAVQKKIPGKVGDRFRDPAAANKNRALNEKITDFARKQFEKMTGKKVPSKVSN
ncbi:MAG: hypothetical protein LQ349_002273 [Xanthoria aureola]|nr:MAG: hypothetical protein LQ349_002273 [Xanthoria aureola]